MNTKTGEIREEKDIPEKEKSNWASVATGMLAALSALSPMERVRTYRREVKTGRSLYFNATIKPPASAEKRKKKRKVQKLARRRNRL